MKKDFNQIPLLLDRIEAKDVIQCDGEEKILDLWIACKAAMNHMNKYKAHTWKLVRICTY